jgi:hypothetical protein
MPFSITQIFVSRNQENTGLIGTRLWDRRMRIRRLILGKERCLSVLHHIRTRFLGLHCLLYSGSWARLFGEKSSRGMKLRTHPIYCSG